MVREKRKMSNSFKQQGLQCLNKGEFVLSVLSVVWNVQDYVVAALTDLGNEYANWRQLYLCRPIWLLRCNIENPSLNLVRFWGATHCWRIENNKYKINVELEEMEFAPVKWPTKCWIGPDEELPKTKTKKHIHVCLALQLGFKGDVDAALCSYCFKWYCTCTCTYVYDYCRWCDCIMYRNRNRYSHMTRDAHG